MEGESGGRVGEVRERDAELDGAAIALRQPEEAAHDERHEVRAEGVGREREHCARHRVRETRQSTRQRNRFCGHPRLQRRRERAGLEQVLEQTPAK